MSPWVDGASAELHERMNLKLEWGARSSSARSSNTWWMVGTAEYQVAAVFSWMLQKAPALNITQIVPRLAGQYRAMVEDLENILPEQRPRDVARARAQIKKFLGGNIIVREAPDEIRLETEQGVGAVALLQAVGGKVGNVGSGGALRPLATAPEPLAVLEFPLIAA